jgi:hypothetical protein
VTNKPVHSALATRAARRRGSRNRSRRSHFAASLDVDIEELVELGEAKRTQPW